MPNPLTTRFIESYDLINDGRLKIGFWHINMVHLIF